MPIILDGTTGITTPGITNTGTFVFQGPVQVPAGTVGAPSVTTDGDTNTGIYFPAADTIGFAEGGVEALRINSSAQIAVNTAGTAGAPVITKTDDLNTGIFFPAADTIAFSEGGVEAMRLDSAGNVGIGTTSPGQRLEVAGNIFINTSGNPYMEVKTSGAGNNPYLRLTADTNNWTIQGTFSNANDELFFMNNSNTRMAITAGGDVGIGTTTPTAKLNISGTSNAVGLGLTGTHSAGDTAINIAPASAITGAYNAIYSYPSASTGVGYVFGNSNTSSSSAHSRVDVLVGGANGGDPKITYTVSGVINWCIGVDNSDSDKFKISASDAPGTSDVVTITSGGLFGLGTATPASAGGTALVVYDASTPRIRLTNSTTGQASSDGGEISLFQGELIIENRESAATRFWIGGSERARIDPDGRFLIKRTSSSFLSTWGVVAMGESAALVGPPDDNAILCSNAYFDGSWKYTNNGYAAILEMLLAGTNVQFFTAGSGNQGNAISWTAGPYIANGGTSWTNSSDERLKSITGEISNGLSKVCSLRAAEFTWKDDDQSKKCVGLIAQDVEKVLPEVISKNKTNSKKGDNTDYLGVAYDQTIPLLVAAIKELKAELDALKGSN